MAEPGQRHSYACCDSHYDKLRAEAERAAVNRDARDARAGVPVRWTRAERRAVARLTNGHCAYCNSKLRIRRDGFSGKGTPAELRFEIDHIVPLARGGRHEASNWVPACRSCNGGRRDALLHEWVAKGDSVRQPTLILQDLASGTGAWARDGQTGEIQLADRAALVRT
jgi:5-methylcytosine-specific restriction endonuclease McrA